MKVTLREPSKETDLVRLDKLKKGNLFSYEYNGRKIVGIVLGNLGGGLCIVRLGGDIHTYVTRMDETSSGDCMCRVLPAGTQIVLEAE